MFDEQSLAEFFSKTHPEAIKLREISRKIEREEAIAFRSITLFKPTETDLSRIVAFLLNPREAHGQSSNFLENFLEILKLPKRHSEYERIRVSLEDTLRSGKGRSDIQVQYRNENGESVNLLLENKPWTVDGAGQMRRYRDHMRSKFKDQRWFLIYISDVPKAPAEHSITQKELEVLTDERRYINLPYRNDPSNNSIYQWVMECVKVCKAERPKRFLEEFLLYLNDTFLIRGETEMSKIDHASKQLIIDFFYKNPQFVRVADFVALGLPAWHKDLVHKTGIHIMKLATDRLGEGWEVGYTPDGEGESKIDKKRDAKFYIRKRNWPKKDVHELLCVAVSFREDNWDGAFLGILGPLSHNDEIPKIKIQTEVTKCYPEFVERNSWICYRADLGPISRNWCSEEFQDFALGIINEPGSQQHSQMLGLVDEIVKLAQICDGVMSPEH